MTSRDGSPDPRIASELDRGAFADAATAVVRGYGPQILGYLRAVLRDQAIADVAFSHSLRIFHVVDDLVVTDDKSKVGEEEKRLPYSMYSAFDARYAKVQHGHMLMLRGGDAILWMKLREPAIDNLGRP